MDYIVRLLVDTVYVDRTGKDPNRKPSLRIGILGCIQLR